MDFLTETLRSDWEALLRFAPRLFYGLVVLGVFLLAARLLRRAVGRLLHRRAALRSGEAFFARFAAWVVGSIGVLLALGVMGFQGVAASMLATGGVVAIVLGFAFREIGENLLAGIFLAFSRPFELGDLIRTENLTGTVRSIALRHVHIRTADACDVFVPNAQIFRQPLYNFTRDGLRRPSFRVGVAYHDDPAAVVELLTRATAGVSEVLADPAPVVSVEVFAAQYVEYEVCFWLDVTKSERGMGGLSNDVRIACWRALKDAGMTFSTDVASGIELKAAPPLDVALATAPPRSD